MAMFGLTGGIGSGKSTVAARLAAHGAVVIDADQIARQVVEPGTPALAALVDHFGADILAADGSLDRGALAARAFTDDASKAALEAITHPAIAAEFFRRIGGHPPDTVIVHDVPLLIETNRVERYEAIIVVVAPLEKRLARLASRGVTRTDALTRMQHQASDDERRAVASWIITNDDDIDHLHAQVDAIWLELSARARSHGVGTEGGDAESTVGPMEWNIADIFEGVADAKPDTVALVSDGKRFTYRELDERSNQLAHVLRARGVGPGDHVGVYLYNSNAYVETVLAAHKLRAVPVNVNYRYVEAELEYLFDNADLVALVHDREFVPRVKAVAAACPRLHTYLAVDDGSGTDLAAIDAIDYELALAAASSERDFEARSPDDLYIVYTGGTTGMPKGVMWRSEDFIKSTILPLISLGAPVATSPEQVVEDARTGNPVIIFTIAPLMHGAAFWVGLMAILSSRELVLSSARSFDPVQIWDTVERERANTILIVGDAMARPLLDTLDANPGRWDLSSMFIVGSGGAILSPTMKDRINELLPNVIISDSHGASETGVQGSVAGTDERGRPRFAMSADTAVLDDQYRPLPAGSPTPGHLARHGHVPIGYYKDPEKSASTFITIDGERWALPGDMAIHEADGTITLLGRGSVSINTGGEKVYPEEVELALKSHPDVFDAVVVGVPDERWGERVAAVVAPVAGASLTLEALVEHSRAQLAPYKLPRELHLVDTVVRSPAGKADYRWAKAIAQRTA